MVCVCVCGCGTVAQCRSSSTRCYTATHCCCSAAAVYPGIRGPECASSVCYIYCYSTATRYSDIGVKRQSGPYISAKEPLYPPKSPMYPPKSPMYPQKSPMYPQKSPLHPQMKSTGHLFGCVQRNQCIRKRTQNACKNALCIRKRALYIHK